jgi:DNA-directed RNA polymerase subunit RPC12/RpoP
MPLKCPECGEKSFDLVRSKEKAKAIGGKWWGHVGVYECPCGHREVIG